MGINRAAIQLAIRQGGFMTRDQLLGLGNSSSAIDRLIRSGDLELVAAGVYRVVPSEDHSDLLRGAILALPGAVASHQSAAHLLDFPRLPELVATVTVSSHTTHGFPDVTVRRRRDLLSEHVTVVEGIRVTTIARTAFDLASVLAPEEFERITEAILIDGRLKMRHLERTSRSLSRRGKPGSAVVNAFVETRSRGVIVASSVLEAEGRRVLGDRGLPRPIPEFPIPWDPNRRFDDAYPEVRVAIEWDSSTWHSQKDAMQSDRQRDREAATHGWTLLRFTWADVTEQADVVAATVAEVLASDLSVNWVVGLSEPSASTGKDAGRRRT